MTISIAYLGPKGTFSEFAAAAYADSLEEQAGQMKAYPTISQAINATEQGEVDCCVVPIENSINGGVTLTLDTLWNIETLHIQQAFDLPVHQALISNAKQLSDIKTVHSHPQALGQCSEWLANNLPDAQLVPARSTAEPLPKLKEDSTTGAIASKWGAKMYDLSVIAHPINDVIDNYTRFWILSKQHTNQGQRTSLAFKLLSNEAGALLKPLQLFAALNLNMSRIESRPTKQLLGDYIFFVDIEASASDPIMQTALELLKLHTATYKNFGSYDLLKLKPPV